MQLKEITCGFHRCLHCCCTKFDQIGFGGSREKTCLYLDLEGKCILAQMGYVYFLNECPINLLDIQTDKHTKADLDVV